MRRAKLWIGAGGVALLLLVVLASAQERKSPAPAAARPFEVDIPTAQEVRAMLGAYGQRVEENERALAHLREELAQARQASERSMTALAETQRRDFAGLETLLRGPAERDPAAPARLRSFDFPAPRPPGRTVHIPAGSHGIATLLSGAFAPTSGEPLPVLLRLEEALVGPQRTRVPIRGALIVGKAQGDANSARAIIQLDTISVVRGDGRAIDAKVNGWVVDDDGAQGVRGTYVWRASEIATLAAATGGLGAAADALAARETIEQATPLGGAVSAVTGDPLRFAGFRALGGAASKIAETVARRLDEIVPAIHVPGGRRVRVAFVSGVTLEGLTPENPEDASPFRGLDLEDAEKKPTAETQRTQR